MAKAIGITLLLSFTIVTFRLFAQSPSFTVPAAVCLNEKIDIQNTSGEFHSFEWDFCVDELAATPSVTNIFSGSTFKIPVGIAIINEGDNYYGLVCSRDNKTIYLLGFGKSLQNAPAVINQYSSPAFTNPEWIKLVKENNKWVGYVVNYTSSNIARLHFRNGLSSAPDVENLGDFGGKLKNPRGLELKEADARRFLFISNTSADQIVRIEVNGSWLGSLNEAELTVIGAGIGIKNPFGISLIKSNANWYGIVSSYGNSRYFQLDFGSTLSSNPVIKELGQISNPTDVKLVEEAGQIYAFGTGGNGDLYRINFGENPAVGGGIENLGNFSGALGNAFGFDVVQEGASWHAFSMNYLTNWLSRIDFQDDCSAKKAYVKGFEPLGVSYSAAGEKVISLKATDIDGNTFFTRRSVTVTEDPAPLVEVIIGNSICVGGAVTLMAVNSTPEIPILSYQWTLPNGQQKAGEEISHTFAEPGTYEVRLDIESANGCTNFIEEKVTLYPEPQAAFTIQETLRCSNAPVTFTNTTTYAADSVLSYTWDFGDGATSLEENPVHEFTEPGTYTIILSASIPGCATTASQTIEIEPGLRTRFEASPACTGEIVRFDNQTTGQDITGFSWDLGDGTFSTLENPEHRYDRPGTYSIVLESINSLGCKTSFTKTVRVYSIPHPAFTTSPVCAGSTVQFKDATMDTDGNIIAWHWEFEMPDGTIRTGNEQNPVVNYSRSGTYNVSLTTTTNWGCYETVQEKLIVTPMPTVEIGFTGACAGGAGFIADVSNTDTLEVQSRYWSVGDDIFADSALAYQFSEPGTYEVFLQLNLKNGCSVQGSRQITIEQLPSADFSFTGACVGQTASFEALMPAAEYTWMINGEKVGDESVLRYAFPVQGAYEVQLRLTNEQGCTNTLRKEVVIGEPPVAAFNPDLLRGGSPFKVKFFNKSKGAVAYRWFFGDKQVSSSELENPVFTFTEIGDYTVKLVAYSEGGCPDTAFQQLSVLNPTYDVALNSLHHISSNNQLQFVLGLENKGTMRVSKMEIEISINNEYLLRKQFTDTLEKGEQLNFPLSIYSEELRESRVDFICITLKPALSQLSEEPSVLNNEKCLNLRQAFVMQSPHPNPCQSKLELNFILPDGEAPVSLFLYSAHGKLVFREEILKPKPGFNQHEWDTWNLAGGIYYVRACYKGKEWFYKIIKN